MIILRNKEFAKKDDREDVPSDIMEKAWKTGVVQQDREGRWRIINRQKKKFWNAIYTSREKAEAGLRGYYSNKH